MTKSYVTLEQNVCPICGTEHDTGNILMNKFMRDTFEHKTITGFALCPEHRKMSDDGYIALVAVDASKSRKEPSGAIKPQGAYRTGDLAFIHRDAASNIFKDFPLDHEFVYCDPEVITALKAMQENSEDPNQESDTPKDP